jgi:RNA polymerase sigma-70 factor (ECF subfamily)
MSLPPSIHPDDESFLQALAAMDATVPYEMRSKFDLADVRQDAWLAAHRHASALEGRPPEERRAYLRRAFHTALLDRIRRFRTLTRRAGREQSLDDSRQNSRGPLGRILAGSESSPSRKAIRTEEGDRLSAALKTLPARQQEAVVLHHIQGQSLRQTAEQMGLSEEAVAGLLYRGLKKLREHLGA